MTENLSTGIGALDLFLDGGIPRGFTLLLLAPSGSGAEIFCKQFAQGGREARRTYITTDETAEELYEAAARAHWDLSGIEHIDIESTFADELLAPQAGDRSKPTRFDPRDLVEGTDSRDLLPDGDTTPSGRVDYLETLLKAGIGQPPNDRFIVDSLDFFFNLYETDAVVSTLQALHAANARQGGVALWVLTKGAHDERTERRLELMADCIIELEVNRRGASFERFLMVRKVKNRPQGAGVSTYALTRDGFVLETLERIA